MSRVICDGASACCVSATADTQMGGLVFTKKSYKYKQRTHTYVCTHTQEHTHTRHTRRQFTRWRCVVVVVVVLSVEWRGGADRQQQQQQQQRCVAPYAYYMRPFMIIGYTRVLMYYSQLRRRLRRCNDARHTRPTHTHSCARNAYGELTLLVRFIYSE